MKNDTLMNPCFVDSNNTKNHQTYDNKLEPKIIDVKYLTPNEVMINKSERFKIENRLSQLIGTCMQDNANNQRKSRDNLDESVLQIQSGFSSKNTKSLETLKSKKSNSKIVVSSHTF